MNSKRPVFKLTKKKKKNQKRAVWCFRPPGNVKIGSFTSWCNEGKEMYKKGDALTKLLFCQSKKKDQF